MRRRRDQDGYAVLLIFAMAATVAISLYLELPRAAFEAQRDREQLLIDRGEQYSRAVQLYVRKFNRFPADFEALNNTQGIRFLRRAYKDPITGKDEWRVVHVGPGGVFTDSLVYGLKKGEKQEQQTFITEMQQVGGGAAAGTPEGVNLASRRRPSDVPGAPGDVNAPGGGGAGELAGQPQQGGPVQVMPDGRVVPAILGSQNGQLPGGGPQQGAAGQPGFPGLPTFPGQQPFPGQAGVSGQPGAPPAAAVNLINQLLTTPRPGGLPGLGGPTVDQFGNPVQGGAATGNPVNTPAGIGTPIQPGAGGQVIGGGIAGVASKREQEGIKIYNGRSDYHEWEFVYDISKDKGRSGGAGIPGAQPVPGQQPNGQQPNGQQTQPAGTSPFGFPQNGPGRSPLPIPPH